MASRDIHLCWSSTLKRLYFACVAMALMATSLPAEFPRPMLDSVYPPGGGAGSEFPVHFEGNSLDGIRGIHCSTDGVTLKKGESGEHHIAIAASVPPGLYDIQLITSHGASSTRRFFVSSLQQHVEEKSDEVDDAEAEISLNTVSSGSIGGPGDIDNIVFACQSGQLVVIELWAMRMDSQLRGVLELYDPDGKRIEVNRGFFGPDPAIVFRAERDGRYRIRLHDLVYSGGSTHFYRLDVHSRGRVLYTVPSVIEAGQATSVDFYGWNLGGESGSDDITVHTETLLYTQPDAIVPVASTSQSTGARQVGHRIANTDRPVAITVAPHAVTPSEAGNTEPQRATSLVIPSTAVGNLALPGEVDWYAIRLRAGEVISLDARGSRLGAPVDLQLHVLSADGKEILATFDDRRANIGGSRFPSSHNDPSGRWLAPSDGDFLIAVRNVISSPSPDRRRIYELAVTRALPTFSVVAIARPQSPSAVNVMRQGRAQYDLLAIRHNGYEGGIHVRALGLPDGVTCPDVFIGPGVTQTPLVLSGEVTAAEGVHALALEATPAGLARMAVKVDHGVVVRTGRPTGWGRTAQSAVWSVAGDAPAMLSAKLVRDRVSQGSIVDIQVVIDRNSNQPAADVQLTGIGLPPSVDNRLARIDSDSRQSVISFYIPPSMPPGKYTVAVSGSSTFRFPVGPDGQETAATIVSNCVTFEVYEAPYVVKLDLSAPVKIRRGEIIQLNYTAIRQNGFIGKIHTDLTAPDGVIGLRARGVTFVGQTEKGVLQVIANDNAPLGRQENLRLEGVGTVEDQPVYVGSCFVWLEIVE